MLNVVFALQCRDVGATECLAAFVAQQVESAEIVSFAERVLPRRLLGYREELGGYDLAAVLGTVSLVQGLLPTTINAVNTTRQTKSHAKSKCVYTLVDQ